VGAQSKAVFKTWGKKKHGRGRKRDRVDTRMIAGGGGEVDTVDRSMLSGSHCEKKKKSGIKGRKHYILEI